MAENEINTSKEELLTLLEELLSITKDVVSSDGPSDVRKQWRAISARVADLRDGEDV